MSLPSDHRPLSVSSTVVPWKHGTSWNSITPSARISMHELDQYFGESRCDNARGIDNVKGAELMST
jgi:hypothetical protein